MCFDRLLSADMHAVYMQSVRSPAVGGRLDPHPNRFKMVARRSAADQPEVFTQDATYCENSFVVGDVGGDAGEEEEAEAGRDQECVLDNTICLKNVISARRVRGRDP